MGRRSDVEGQSSILVEAGVQNPPAVNKIDGWTDGQSNGTNDQRRLTQSRSLRVKKENGRWKGKCDSEEKRNVETDNPRHLVTAHSLEYRCQRCVAHVQAQSLFFGCGTLSRVHAAVSYIVVCMYELNNTDTFKWFLI